MEVAAEAPGAPDFIAPEKEQPLCYHPSPPAAQGAGGDQAQGTAAAPTGHWGTDAPSAGAVFNTPTA